MSLMSLQESRKPDGRKQPSYSVQGGLCSHQVFDWLGEAHPHWAHHLPSHAFKSRPPRHTQSHM